MADSDQQQVRRRLAAIMSADVRGYARLMEDDELATLQTLTQYRELMGDRVAANHGRVVDSPGDNLLAEFPSVMDAVQASVQIQRQLAARNEQLPEHRRMDFRIGINCGDVLVDGDSIYGDGVNIAARLEGEADPGGVCVSGQAYAQVRNKVGYGFCPLGELKVKNIAQPVEAWKLEMDPDGADCQTGFRAVLGPGRRRSRLLLISAAVVVLAGLTALAWLYDMFSPVKPEPDREIMAVVTAPPVPPDLPSVAVMPFANLSDNQAEEYFADGVTEDVITDLSQISGLFVVSRAASFSYKSRSVLPAEVGRELGVRYLVEGSVRRSADRIRVSAKLINAETGFQLWADRWDRDVADIFALQDELTHKIVFALEVNLSAAERERLARRGTDNVQAYEFVKRGRELANRYTRPANRQAREMFARAIELDRDYALAYVGLGWAHFQEWPLGWAEAAQSLEPALEYGRRALAIDDSLPEAHVLVGWALLWQRRFDPAVGQGRRALELDPNNAEALSFLANALGFTGEPKQALEMAKRAVRLNPRLDTQDLYSLAHALWLLDSADQAAELLDQIIERTPSIIPVRVLLARILVAEGRWEAAQAQVAAILELDPGYNVVRAAARLPYRDKTLLQAAVEALKAAGLPNGETRPATGGGDQPI